MPEENPKAPEDDLSKRYDALLHDRNWSVDEPEAPGELSEAAGSSATPAALLSPERIIEALLFVGGMPLTAARAADAIRGLTPAQFLEAIAQLNRAYRSQGRPYHIQARERGYVLGLRPQYRGVVDKLFGSNREARLSLAAVDVLALVAYRQPATRQEIDSLRGAESGALLRQLVRRGLVSVVHSGDAAQKEVAYGTTPRFLELFGLKSLEDLPQTQDLQRL
jgi:segregation and condensation protein B